MGASSLPFSSRVPHPLRPRRLFHPPCRMGGSRRRGVIAFANVAQSDTILRLMEWTLNLAGNFYRLQPTINE